MSVRTWTVFVAVLVLTLIGGPALGYFSTSPKTVGVTITAAHEFPSDEDEDSDEEDDGDDQDDDQEDDQEDDQADDGEQVWICKLTGQPDDPQLAKQNNPRQVNGSAVEDGVFNDEHGSPVVQDGDVDCDDVWPPASTTAVEADASDEAADNDETDAHIEGDDSEDEDEENEEDGDDDGGDVDDEDEDDDL